MSFDWKSLSKKELDYIFKDFDFKVTPRVHQMITLAFTLGQNLNRVMLFQGVGTGKTLCSLFLTQVWNCKKILVVCPNPAFSAWERDISFGTDYSYVLLTGTKKERLKKLKEEHNVYIVNYEGLKVLYCNLVKGKGWKIVPSLLDSFDCIIVDEAHRVNNYKSLQTRICFELSKRAQYVIGMTGTAVDKSMLELFNIYKVVDLGESLGRNFFLYRNAYFYKIQYKLRNGRYIFDWKLKKGMKEKILKAISRNTISFEREECFDLPDLQEVELKVKPSKEFFRLQDRVIKGLPIEVDDTEIDCSEVETRANQLRELSGGFLYYTEDDEKKSYHLKENPKLEALLDLIESTTSKILVFYWYAEERSIIEKALKKNKIGFVSIYGGQDSIERKEVVKQFLTSDTQVMLAQARISEGYDASAANIVVFYLPLGSPRMRQQCIGRIHRSGQTRKCLVYDLVLENSVDSRIIEDRGERFSLVNSVRKYMQSYCQENGEI